MFAILSEVLLIENPEEIHHFAGWEGGGLTGTKIVNKHFVNKRAFPINISTSPGLYRDWVGGRILFMLVWGSFLVGEQTHKQNPH